MSVNIDGLSSQELADLVSRANKRRKVLAKRKPAAQVKSSGEFVSVAVPEGSDGKVWSMTQLALGHLYFFNAPNTMAGSAEALLVPRDTLIN